MLIKFYAVRCDRCGVESTGRVDMPSEAPKARRVARQRGFKRLDVPAKYGGTTKVDACSQCAPVIKAAKEASK